MSAPTACWRHGAWRTSSWRAGSWRGFGDDFDVAVFRARHHPGWDRDRATLRLARDRDYDRAVREIYRAVTGAPETAARAAEIMAPYLAQIEGLQAQRLGLERMTAESEIALHMLYDDLQAMNDQRDEAAIVTLLPRLL